MNHTWDEPQIPGLSVAEISMDEFTADQARLSPCLIAAADDVGAYAERHRQAAVMSLSDGSALDLLSDDPGAQITLEDTAHALAQTNRFVGRASRPYSVAAHSLLVYNILSVEFSASNPVLYGGLMHDAHEAVTGDASTPSKVAMRRLGLDWDRYEAHWQSVFERRFGYAHSELIKQADLIALAAEKQVLMPRGGHWPCIEGVRTPRWATLAVQHSAQHPWCHWRDTFIAAAKGLCQ